MINVEMSTLISDALSTSSQNHKQQLHSFKRIFALNVFHIYSEYITEVTRQCTSLDALLRKKYRELSLTYEDSALQVDLASNKTEGREECLSILSYLMSQNSPDPAKTTWETNRYAHGLSSNYIIEVTSNDPGREQIATEKEPDHEQLCHEPGLCCQFCR
jgi:hypothetical protein